MIDAPDDVADIGNFDARAVDAADRTDDRSICHEEIDVAAVSKRMPEAEDFFAVDGGNGAGCSDRKIAVDDRHADRRAGLERRVVINRASVGRNCGGIKMFQPERF